MNKQYFVLVIEGDVEPVLYGPYESEEIRDKEALELRRQDSGDLKDGIFPLETWVQGHTGTKAAVSVDTYSGAFFEEVL